MGRKSEIYCRFYLLFVIYDNPGEECIHFLADSLCFCLSLDDLRERPRAYIVLSISNRRSRRRRQIHFDISDEQRHET
jgi:hypothetical protein